MELLKLITNCLQKVSEALNFSYSLKQFSDAVRESYQGRKPKLNLNLWRITTMKKVLSLVLAVLMVLSLSVVAMAKTVDE